MTDPLELLQRLRVSVLTRQLSADVAMWLQCAVDDYLTGAGTMDECLGLKSQQGKNGSATAIKLQRRDDLVRRLARGLDGSTWEQAGTLAQIIADFNPQKPKPIMQSKYLAEAHRLGFDIPRSRMQICRILNGRRAD